METTIKKLLLLTGVVVATYIFVFELTPAFISFLRTALFCFIMFMFISLLVCCLYGIITFIRWFSWMVRILSYGLGSLVAQIAFYFTYTLFWKKMIECEILGDAPFYRIKVLSPGNMLHNRTAYCREHHVPQVYESICNITATLKDGDTATLLIPRDALFQLMKHDAFYDSGRVVPSYMIWREEAKGIFLYDSPLENPI